MCPPSLVEISAIYLKTEKNQNLTPDAVSAEENWNVKYCISRWHRVNNTTEIHHKIPQTQWSYTLLPYNKQHIKNYGCLLKLSAIGLRQSPRHYKKKYFSWDLIFIPFSSCRQPFLLKKCSIYNDTISIVNVASILCLCMLWIIFKVS